MFPYAHIAVSLMKYIYTFVSEWWCRLGSMGEESSPETEGASGESEILTRPTFIRFFVPLLCCFTRTVVMADVSLIILKDGSLLIIVS